jgi:hypothetical protein
MRFPFIFAMPKKVTFTHFQLAFFYFIFSSAWVVGLLSWSDGCSTPGYTHINSLTGVALSYVYANLPPLLLPTSSLLK